MMAAQNRKNHADTREITRILRENRHLLNQVVREAATKRPVVVLDLTRTNAELADINLANPEDFSAYVEQKLREADALVAIGRYGEDRQIYDHSPLFAGGTRRTIHLGIDLNTAAGTEVRAPLAGTVHSFADNAGIGDYGPTIILEHELDGVQFFTLYGHLSPSSIETLARGTQIRAGELIGWIGTYPENGNWPPHLHFQIITDMFGKEGDFPGVCSTDEKERFLALCPDPNLILGLPGLERREE